VRVAALNDVHGNLPALEAVLAEVAALTVDRMVVGGDVVGGPFEQECVALLLEHDAAFVRGNAERGAPEPVWLRELPHALALDGVLYCHGSPRRDDEILTRVSPDERFRAALAGVEERVVVGGHTHVQFQRELDGILFANAGSVGRPYEGRRGAFWALVEDGRVELRHTPYAIEAAVAAIRATGYVDADALCATLLHPEDPDEASRYFESLAT
jgi:putative phosphoesterase